MRCFFIEKERKKERKKREREKIQQTHSCVYISLDILVGTTYLVSWVSATLKYVYVRSAKPRHRESSKWRGIVCQLRKSLGMFGVSCPADLFHTKEEEREREKKEREEDLFENEERWSEELALWHTFCVVFFKKEKKKERKKIQKKKRRKALSKK